MKDFLLAIAKLVAVLFLLILLTFLGTLLLHYHAVLTTAVREKIDPFSLMSFRLPLCWEDQVPSTHSGGTIQKHHWR